MFISFKLYFTEKPENKSRQSDDGPCVHKAFTRRSQGVHKASEDTPCVHKACTRRSQVARKASEDAPCVHKAFTRRAQGVHRDLFSRFGAGLEKTAQKHKPMSIVGNGRIAFMSSRTDGTGCSRSHFIM